MVLLNYMQTRNIIVLAGLLILAAGAFFVFGGQETVPAPSAAESEVPEGAHVITLTKEGFEPAEITIRKGETVAFRSTAGDLFWPASNLHPSHGIYPEFDPKEPVQPDAVWSFTFDSVGEWKFHDHLAPYFTGVITVTE